MWNYDEIDKYITFEHLQLLMAYLAANPVRERLSDMLAGIDRKGNEYTLHITSANAGYQHRFAIADGQVNDLGISDFWMS